MNRGNQYLVTGGGSIGVTESLTDLGSLEPRRAIDYTFAGGSGGRGMGVNVHVGAAIEAWDDAHVPSFEEGAEEGDTGDADEADASGGGGSLFSALFGLAWGVSDEAEDTRRDLSVGVDGVLIGGESGGEGEADVALTANVAGRALGRSSFIAGAATIARTPASALGRLTIMGGPRLALGEIAEGVLGIGIAGVVDEPYGESESASAVLAHPTANLAAEVRPVAAVALRASVVGGLGAAIGEGRLSVAPFARGALGVGARVQNFRADLTVSPDFLVAGPYQVSGNAAPWASQASVAYTF